MSDQPTLAPPVALLITLLREGAFDHRLDEVVESIVARRRVIDANAAAKLYEGSEVVAPKGSGRRMPPMARGTVTGFTRSGKVKVDFGPYGSNWTFPAALLTLIEA